MSVVLSGSLTLSGEMSGGGVITADNPIIGYQNLASASSMATTTEATTHSAANLANVSTALYWQGVLSSPPEDEYITITLNTENFVDYIGIAKHNFYTEQIEASVEVLDDSSPAEWTEIVSGVIPPNDGPIIFRFTPQAITQIRVRLRPGNAAPRAAVLYVGALLVMQRRIYVNHRPVSYAVNTDTVNAMSENGSFLGRIVMREMVQTDADFTNLTPTWYRTYFDPFAIAAREAPFFFAWRPGTYPDEVGFMWVTDNPIPNNALPNGMMSVTLSMKGVK
jgi:hypothetical protein